MPSLPLNGYKAGTIKKSQCNVVNKMCILFFTEVQYGSFQLNVMHDIRKYFVHIITIYTRILVYYINKNIML